jgi:hypothetical protein
MNSLVPTLHSFFLFGMISLATVACGGDGGDGDGDDGAGGTSSSGGSGSGNTGNTGNVGNTTCGASNCEAGQHCNNGVCVNGCLTDANCGSNQSCQDIDDVTSTGTCRNNPTAPMKDCDALCQKAQACNDPNAADCYQLCDAASAECVACLIDSNCGEGCDDACAF